MSPVPAVLQEPRTKDEPLPYRDRPSEVELTPDDKQWAMFAHLSALVAGFVGFTFLGPLIVWLIKKDQSRFVDDQGKEALNFQLNLLIHGLVLIAITIATCGFGLVLFIPWGIYALVMPIIGGVAANKGEYYRYPATIRFLT